ncbi:MAG: phosphonate metabolism transcriptional regulator PhnF [Rhizobacter sp.]|nr:phosphonate metabolism transcriptional regulator PhnF [Rhizobacter sp.]
MTLTASSPPAHTPATTDTPARRWETIAASLRHDIVQGRLRPGEKLPNESALALRFGVNRHTLRQAVQSLAQEGFVRVVQGSGTYVRELVLDYALQRRTRLSHNLAAAGETADRQLLGHEVVRGGEWARDLRLPGNARVQLLYTRACVRGRPVNLCTAAYPLPRLAGMVEAFTEHGSITQALAQLGVADYTRAHSVVSCRLPSAAEADALARPATQPVLVVRYVNVDTAGAPVEAGCTLFAADAVQLTVQHGGGDA